MLSVSSLSSLCVSFRPRVVSLLPPHVPLSQTAAFGAFLRVMWPSVLQQLSPVLPQKPQVSPQIHSARTLLRRANRRLNTSFSLKCSLTACHFYHVYLHTLPLASLTSIKYSYPIVFCDVIVHLLPWRSPAKCLVLWGNIFNSGFIYAQRIN